MANNPSCSINDAFGVQSGNLYVGRTQIGWVPIGQPVILSSSVITYLDGVAVTPGATFAWFEAEGTRTLHIEQKPDPDDGNTIKNAVYIDWSIQLSLVSSLTSVFQVDHVLNGTTCKHCIYMPSAFIPEDKSIIYGGARSGDFVIVDLETGVGSVIFGVNEANGGAFGSVFMIMPDPVGEALYVMDSDGDLLQTDLSGGNIQSIGETGENNLRGHGFVVGGYGFAVEELTSDNISRFTVATETWEHDWLTPGWDALQGIYPDLPNEQFLVYGSHLGNARLARYATDGTLITDYFTSNEITDPISGICLPSESDDGRFHIATFASEIYSCEPDGSDVQLESATGQDLDFAAFWAWNRAKFYFWDSAVLKSLDLPDYDNLQTVYTIPTPGTGAHAAGII